MAPKLMRFQRAFSFFVRIFATLTSDGRYPSSGGESGIRTHGPRERVTGFQDRLLKPLGHLSI